MVTKSVYLNEQNSGLVSIPITLVKKLKWQDGQILACIINKNKELILTKEHIKHIVTSKMAYISYIILRKVKNKHGCNTHRIYLTRDTVNLLGVSKSKRLVELVEKKGGISIKLKQ